MSKKAWGKISDRTLVKKIVGLAIAFTLILTTFVVSPANAAANAEFQIHCMNHVMYYGNRRRSEISETAASNACQNASTAAESNYISSCMNDLMYKPNSVIREKMNAVAAASVCQKATTPMMVQKVSKCMKDNMYDANGHLKRSANANRAAKQCTFS